MNSSINLDKDIISNESMFKDGLQEKGYFINIKNNEPLISVITVVYNGLYTIEETIQSVLRQTYNNIEFIIIDGGSIDGTVDIIRKYDSELDYWISEKDLGIYDAMNKGIAMATGNRIVFMNSGDKFSSFDVFNQIDFTKFSSNQIFAGNVIYTSGKKIIPMKVPMWKKNAVHHQAVIYPKSLFENFGNYKLRYKILSDYEMNLRAIKYGFTFCAINIDFAICSDGGVSDTPKFLNYKEEIEIRWIYYSNIFVLVIGTLYSITRYFFKKLTKWIY